MAPLLLKLLASSLTRPVVQISRFSLSGAYRGLCTLTAAPRTHHASTPGIGSTHIAPAAARHGASLLGRCRPLLPSILPSAGMKTKSALKRRCKDCFFVWRRGRLFVFCKTHPRHKQRQG